MKSEENIWNMEAIARIRSEFPTKFGIPRQSGLVDELRSEIVFAPRYRSRDALRGLEDFSHIWLIWIFDRTVRRGIPPHAPQNGKDSANTPETEKHSANTPETEKDFGNTSETEKDFGNASNAGQRSADMPEKTWSATVRPPRLGGNQRMGVFATRSPFRPNPIGLSCVRLAGIEERAGEGPVLLIRGADLADNTPILDIKPYVPYADAVTDAAGGFAAGKPESGLTVEIPPELLLKLPEEHREALRGVLAQDPRPRYQTGQEKPSRVYGFGFAEREIRFTVHGGTLTVTEIL